MVSRMINPDRSRHGVRQAATGVAAVVLTTLVTAVFACTAVAGGHHALRVSGGYSLSGLGTTDCIPIDDIRLRCTTTDMEFDYTGDLTGSTTIRFEQIVNCETGVTGGQGIETFTGWIGGAFGTVTWHLSFTSDFDCQSGFPSSLRAIAKLRKRQGTGELAGFGGRLRFDDTAYSGVLR